MHLLNLALSHFGQNVCLGRLQTNRQKAHILMHLSYHCDQIQGIAASYWESISIGYMRMG